MCKRKSSKWIIIIKNNDNIYVAEMTSNFALKNKFPYINYILYICEKSPFFVVATLKKFTLAFCYVFEK